MTKVNKFGTFSGVFTPSILTILGVIMYLRLPMIVGEAGLWATLGIIVLAHLISATTGLSISSIATDKRVEAGGTYYMVSRSLGLPIGGTLGLALFVGLSFSVSLYLIGFAESFLAYWEYEVSITTIRITGTIVLIAVTVITIISTSLAIKAQYLIMGAIILSLISVAMGHHEFGPTIGSIGERPSTLVPFMVLFGIFFPAVTGFEAGVSMSGDLKDPKRSIPLGSIMAIIVGLIVYLGLAVFFALTVDPEMLVGDSQVLLKISLFPGLVIAGIWGATLSSALGSILGAPRILQAIAVDKIAPRWFAKGAGSSNEPRNALVLTFLIAEAGILIGELDVIARIVSIFFITTYGFINLSCAFETWTSADFRPTFKTPAWISLLGAVACFIVMIELDFIATLGAIVILGTLYLFLKRKELSLQTGDAWSGVWSSLVKTSLLRLVGSREHTRNWRPNILMFNGADKDRPFMLNIGSAITGKLGLLSSFELTQSDRSAPVRIARHKEPLNDHSKMFHHTYACEDIYSGIDEIIRVYGFAGIEPNTVLMGWSNKSENKEKFIALMNHIQQYNFNALFLHHSHVAQKITHPSIDIWWSGRGRNLALALNILKHLTTSGAWSRSAVRLCTILNSPDDKDKVERFLRNILTEYRTTATLKIIDNHLTQQGVPEIIGHVSTGTDLTLIGINDSPQDDREATYDYAAGICGQLNTALFISASETFEEYDIIPHSDAIAAALKKNEWILPELEESKYAEIDIDIAKIDEHGDELVVALYSKVFKPCFQLEGDIYNKINALAETTSASLLKAVKQDQQYQRRVGIERVRKHFFKEVGGFLENELSHLIKDQGASIQEGMLWYLKQIESDINRFPKFRYIRHEREKFKVYKTDPAALRWFKFKERALHPFSAKPISLKIRFREGGAYFFRDTRYHFLTMLIDDVEKVLSTSRAKLRHFLAWADESFYTAMDSHAMLQQESVVKDFAGQMVARIRVLLDEHHDSLSRCLGRLQLEYRKNTNFFMHQLERIDFNAAVRKKSRTHKFYQKKKKTLINFSSKWSEAAIPDISSTKANITLYQYYGAAHEGIRAFNVMLARFFENQNQKIGGLAETLSEISLAPDNDSAQLLVPEIDTDYKYLHESLLEMCDRLLLVAEDIAEEVIVVVPYNKEEKEFRLPLRAMVIHLAETVISSHLEAKLGSVLEEVKRISFTISDRARLAIFNLVNLKKEQDQAHRAEEMKMAIISIKEESAELSQITKSVADDIDELCKRLKNALQLHELAHMAGDFSTSVHLRKTRLFRSKVSERIYRVAGAFNKAFVSVLYSQTKGILLARQLSSDVRTLSVNERIVEQAKLASPKPDILLALPHYYVSLFNRRSSIGDNFWVPRPKEENELETAHQRFLASGRGMILVLGEPNAGKSGLCRHFAHAMSGIYTAYHVFPPDNGSISIEDFEGALQKATGLKGNSNLLFGVLPQNSMIVLHDLELWWERSEPSGLDVIRHIRWLVDEFSGKCLFVVNTTPFAFSIINTAEPLDIDCAGVVRCMPFNSFELKQLIMTRHNSSGLSLDFATDSQRLANQIRIARVFNGLFAYSNGSPGVAMNAWLAGIQHYADKSIAWKIPLTQDVSAIKEMPEVWGHLCFQLLIHNRMSAGKLARCLQLPEEQILELTTVMQRLHLITEYAPSVYTLNPNLELLLVNYCKEKEWI